MKIITRKEAKERGLDRYYTGKPCKYGHVDERYLSYGGCVACRKGYREENKEYTKEYNKKWYEENKEYEKERNKKWRGENKEYRNEYMKGYNRNRYATNESYRMAVHCRSMVNRILKATSSTKDTPTYEALGYCNEALKQNIESKFLDGMSWEDDYDLWHIDHKYPVSRYIKDGVTDPALINALDNLIPMWAEHNLEKGDMTLEEYLEVRSDLVDVYGRFL